MEQAFFPQLLTARAVSKALGVSDETVYALFRAGDLPAIRIGRQWRCSQESLDAWVRAKEAQARTNAAADRATGPDMLG